MAACPSVSSRQLSDRLIEILREEKEIAYAISEARKNHDAVTEQREEDALSQLAQEYQEVRRQREGFPQRQEAA